MFFNEETIDAVLEVVDAAGQEILKRYESAAKVSVKDDGTPVTETDRASEDIIVEGLSSLFPSDPIVAEERVSEGELPDISGNSFWLVDALDGTREYIKRSGEFTINIAFISNGCPVFGIISCPVLGEVFVGAVGENKSVVKARLAGQWSRLSAPYSPSEPWRAVLSHGYKRSLTQLELPIGTLPIRASERRLGSALKFCRIAQGKADVYPRFGPTSEWDTAAGHAILLALGGDVLTHEGQKLAYGKLGEKFRNPHFLAVNSFLLNAIEEGV